MTVRRRWLRGDRKRIAPRVLALIGVLGLNFITCGPTRPDCAHAVEEDNLDFALETCREEYHDTRDPWTGVRYADQLRRGGELAAAKALATDLLPTPAQSDALQELGKIAKRESAETAQALLEDARVMHIAEGRYQQAAIDDQQLADLHQHNQRFAEALHWVDNCIIEARTAKAARIKGYCHVTAAQILSDIGHYEAALEELKSAEPLLVSPRGRDDLEIERGTALLRNGFGTSHDLRTAICDFTKAIADASIAHDLNMLRKAESNLVFALAELGDARSECAADASHHLEILRRLNGDGQDTDTLTYLDARIAYRQHNYALARSLDAGVFDKLEKHDDYRLRIAVAEADMALRADELDEAIRWARRGVEIADPIRNKGSAVELRSMILSARREPYEQLFVAYVRAERFVDALIAFDRWQGRTLLDKLARGAPASPATLPAAAVHADNLSRYLPILSQASIVQPADHAALLAGLEHVDLVALAVADGELWRIISHHGNPQIVRIGKTSELETLLDDFRGQPAASALGDALGEKLLGADAFRSTDETLYVLLDDDGSGRIARLPVAALRSQGRPLAALRRIVEPGRLSELDCVPPLHPVATRVVAETRAVEDLPYAREEARGVAAATGAMLSLDDNATSSALFAAGPDDHLHVAGHASVGKSGGELRLHDRTVPALEISTHRDGPAVVFLDACESGAARNGDSEEATSLATAFLASGSKQVIATLRPVDDKPAADVAHMFYANGGIADPASVLAHVQATLAETANADWPYFVLYGHDICREGAQ